MPKKKITLDEAFAVFEREGLKVKIEAIQPEPQKENINDFLETPRPETLRPIGVATNRKNIKITLYAAHSIACGGDMVVDTNGDKTVAGNIIQTYGPGVVTVPVELASHLLHQDMLAQRADDRMLDRRMRSYIIMPKATAHGVVNAARLVSMDNSLNMVQTLASLGDNSILTF